MSSRMGRGRDHCQRRAGTVLIVVLLVLVLCVALGTRLAHSVASGKNVSRAAARELQADWLAESGVRRAAARLAADVNYAGEIWTLEAESLGGPDKAEVKIRVERAEEQPLMRRVIVEAEYLSDAAHRARRSREINLQLVEQGEQS